MKQFIQEGWLTGGQEIILILLFFLLFGLAFLGLWKWNECYFVIECLKADLEDAQQPKKRQK